MKSMKLLCPYCAIEIDVESVTDDHILPVALGGEFLPRDLNILSACKSCNSTLGLWVDGAYARQPFIDGYLTTNAYDYLHEKHVRYVPFAFVGNFSDESLLPNMVMDVWLHPCGSKVFHLRNKDEQRWQTRVGGNPIVRKKNSGFVFAYLGTENIFWIITFFYALKRDFRDCSIVAGNFEPNTRVQLGLSIKQATEEDLSKIAAILRKLQEQAAEDNQAEQWKLKLSVNMDYEERFLAKIALGFGTKFFGESFANSSDGELLRKVLWAKTPEERANLPFKLISNFAFDNKNTPIDIKALLGWRGGITLSFSKLLGGISIFIAIGEKHISGAQISDDPSFVGSKQFSDGIGEVFIIVPALERSVGPIPFLEFLQSKVSGQVHGSLGELESVRRPANSPLPACGEGCDNSNRIATNTSLMNCR